MELLVLRHAKSSWSQHNLADFDRPLKKRGYRDAERMGLYLKERQLLPDTILSSSAVRARQTLELALPALGFDPARITWSRRFYHAEPDVWLEAVRILPLSTARCLIVGHNPGLEELLTLLCPAVPVPADDKILPTAGLAHLQWEGPASELAPGSARIVELQRPRWLECPET